MYLNDGSFIPIDANKLARDSNSVERRLKPRLDPLLTPSAVNIPKKNHRLRSLVSFSTSSNNLACALLLEDVDENLGDTDDAGDDALLLSPKKRVELADIDDIRTIKIRHTFRIISGICISIFDNRFIFLQQNDIRIIWYK